MEGREGEKDRRKNKEVGRKEGWKKRGRKGVMEEEREERRV